jgi:hypothetical protein
MLGLKQSTLYQQYGGPFFLIRCQVSLPTPTLKCRCCSDKFSAGKQMGGSVVRILEGRGEAKCQCKGPGEASKRSVEIWRK